MFLCVFGLNNKISLEARVVCEVKRKVIEVHIKSRTTQNSLPSELKLKIKHKRDPNVIFYIFL